MADIVIDTDDNDGFVFSTADSTLTLNAGITLSKAGVALDASSLADNRSIIIDGTVSETAGNGFRGVAIDINGALSSVVISETGRVKSEKVGIKLVGDDGTIDIAGTVISGAIGVTMDGEGSRLTVSGKLRSSTTAIVMGEGFGDQTIVNTGLIRGDNVGFSLLGAGTLFNQKGGVITGPENFGSDVRQVIDNRGTINGDVFLEGGNDVYSGTGGTLNGRVFGGTGDDLYFVDDTKTRIRENENEGASDAVFSDVTFTLGANFEALFLGGKKNIDGFGNGLDNVLFGNSGNNRLEGKSGDDFFEGGKGADFFAGGEGRDSIGYFNALAGVTINLATGKAKGSDAAGDRFSGIEDIFGSKFDDLLTGNSKKNAVAGGVGDDTLTGGGGRDTFVFSGGGQDTITDFEDGKDILDIQDFSDIASFDDIKDFIIQKNGDTIIDLGTFSEGVTIRLENTKAAELDASDFIF